MSMCKIQDKAPLLPITSSSPHLEKSSVDFECILLITDHFTRYTKAYPTSNKTTKTAATHLCNNFVIRFSISTQLLHNQGPKFENAIFKYVANLLDIKKKLLTTQKQIVSLKG